MKLLLDTNVVLDVLLEREPFAEPARRLWALVESGKAEGVLAAHTVTTVWYLAAEARTRAFAREVVSLVAEVFGVAAVDRGVVRRALGLDLADFEDAVCAAAAEGAECDLLVTRNGKDYRQSPVTAVDPMTALALIGGGGPKGVWEGRGRYRGGRKAGTVKNRPGGRAVGRKG